MAEKSIKLDMVIGVIITIVFIIISYIGLPFFEKMERRIYDIGIRFAVANDLRADKIALIDIDDKSLSDLGAWPWPRHVIAEMIDILNGEGAKSIGLNIPFTEKEINEGLKEVKAFREKYIVYPHVTEDISIKSWVLTNLDEIENRLDNDSSLLESVKKGGNIILPLSARPVTLLKDIEDRDDSFILNNVLDSSRISPSFKKNIEIKIMSSPFTELAQGAAGLGHDDLTSENSMAGRSHPIYRSYKGDLLPSFPLRLAIFYLNQQPDQVIADENQIKLEGRLIPLTRGEMLISFKGGDKTFSRFSFSDVLRDKQTQSKMKGKIIIIGFNNSDSIRLETPIYSNMAESDFNAYIVSDIINLSPITRPAYLLFIEILLIFLVGIGASLLFPRKGQLTRILMTAGILLLTLMAGIIILSVIGIWFKPVYISCCIVAVYLYLLAKELFFYQAFTRESHEMSRLLGLNFQSQGLLDLAFDKFRKLPMNHEAKDLIYNLGLEYEKRRLINKALTAYQYVNKEGGFRDLDDRIPKLMASDKSSTLGSYGMAKEAKIVSDSETADRSMIGRYKILGELGKGSMGLVFKAQDPKINRLVAIKTIRFSDEFDHDVIQEIKERFFREAEIAGQLSHPSIVTIHDVGDDGELTYMAMEFLEGKDLDKFINRGNLLPLRKVLSIVAEIASALDYAHKASVIHRDIKPANVMMLNNGHVKVTDFGIAKAISSSRTKTGVILGTPNYMSPEQIMGQKIDSKSDIFSLGVVFYQLITGELPFHGENLSGLLYQITQIKHPSPRNYNPKIPKVCEQILDKSMAKDPDKRFNSAGDMARILNALGEKIDKIMRERSLKK
jgi:CHASE2 domain-containing sensor protein/tRNA A-37 threonylcarbamoyl transferase component Bud32